MNKHFGDKIPCMFQTIPDRSGEEAHWARAQPGGWNANWRVVGMASGPLRESFSGLQGLISDLRPKYVY